MKILFKLYTKNQILELAMEISPSLTKELIHKLSIPIIREFRNTDTFFLTLPECNFTTTTEGNIEKHIQCYSITDTTIVNMIKEHLHSPNTYNTIKDKTIINDYFCEHPKPVSQLFKKETINHLEDNKEHYLSLANTICQK